jgi:uncharacterized membrane protein YccC
MGPGKSSVRWTFSSHSHSGEHVNHDRASPSTTGGLLGGNRNAGRAAVNAGATLVISVERIAATALGALAGALLAMYFSENLFMFAAAVFITGLLCAVLRMEKSAYRYASVTVAIIVLIPRSNAEWIIALHRFVEVSMGILVALALAAAWQEHQRESPKQNDA